MDTWRSDTADDDGEVIDLLSIDDYNAFKAKVQASLSWVLQKAYEDQVPPEFSNPFYERAEGDWQIKPRLANLLANSELYCQACHNMFGENASQWQGHWSIIQVLSRKGIYAAGSDSTDVTETILMQTSPFKIKAHIALIDALMLAFSREIITIERVTQCVRRFASFNASSELPSDLEDAILFWINKVCVTVQQNLNKKETGSQVCQQDPVTTPRDGISVPVMENFMADVGDGCCLAVLLNFYCPQIVKLEDVYLKSVVGIADSLYNLRLIRTFCDKYIPNKTCHFTYEDLLYSKEPLKENFLVMVAELFYWFEIRPLSVVTGGGKLVPVSGEGDGQQPASTGKPQSSSTTTSVKVPNVPISSITKQSFQRLKGDSELRSSSTPDIHRLSPSAPVQHRVPLLHKRQQQGHTSYHDDHSFPTHSASVQRAHSLTSKDLKPGSVHHQSVLAWQDRGQQDVNQQDIAPDTNITGSNLLANVSIDSEMNGSFSSGSIDLGDLEPTPRTDRTDQTYTKEAPHNTIHFSLQNQQRVPEDTRKQSTPYAGDLNLESVNSERSGVALHVDGSEELQRGEYSNEPVEESDARGVNLHVEPLMPARLKPLKEKSNIHTKEEERGDNSPRKKIPSPPRLKKGVEFNPEIETINRSAETSRSDDTLSDGQITPLPEDQISPRDNLDPQSLHMMNLKRVGLSNAGLQPAPKKFEAFFIRGSLTESQDTSIPSHRSDLDDAFVKESFTISDEIHTPEAARAAGIPIIDSSEHHFARQASREGSIASSRSSGDFSDHESRKIHFDHKTRESSKSEPGQNQESSRSNITSPGQYIIQKPVMVTRMKDNDKSNKPVVTNFAAIKQTKQLGTIDNSGLIYMQHGQEGEEKKNPLKEALQKNKSEKKTTFAPLPNQRTWQQSITTANQNQDSAAGQTNGGTASQELLKIKMKLEEKRKAIERKKHSQEIQQQKLRQRLGKAAFMQVLAKPKEEEEEEGGESTGGRPTSLAPSRMTTSDPQVPVEPKPLTAADRNVMNISDSSGKSMNTHRFSRDDIQQTIENVKKKWFNGDNSVSSRIEDEEYSQQRTESPERTRTRRSLSVESREPEVAQRISPKRDTNNEDNVESYEEYNSSLDKLNQSLTDLQGEIMKLSLKQKQSGQVANKISADTEKQNKNDNSVNTVSRSRSPPNVLEVKSKGALDTERVAESGRPRGAQLRSSSEPRQIVSEQAQEEQIGNYQSHTLPRHPPFQQNQVSPFMMQGHVSVAGPAGPVYSNPNQFVPVPSGTGMVPTPQQYGSYLMGPTHPQQMGQIPPQQITPPYQQSPPHMYPQTTPMYGQPFAQQNIMSPQSQPYPTMYVTQPQPQYQPHPHIASTYTTPSHPQHAPYTQPMTVTQQPEPTVNGTNYTQVQNVVPSSNQTVSQESAIKSHVSVARSEPDNYKSDSSHVTETRTQDTDGFFISMHENSPRRQKVQTSDQKAKTDLPVSGRKEKESVINDTRQVDSSNLTEQSSLDSSVISDFAQKISDKQPELDRTTESQSDTSQTKLDETASTLLDTTGVGFVIGQDESMLDQSAEIEMQKKKDKIIQMRLRRQEEQEMKRQKKEQEAQRKREAERLKQEESERRKSEEKARREQIFRQYLEKKEEDEDGTSSKKREEKTKQKPRPKSMFVRVGPGSNLDEGLENSASNEDLSARAFTISAGGHNSTASKGRRSKHPPSPSRTMRKAVSCNTLDQKHPGTGDSKNLAFGGLTHRRPPSPDLYRIRKGQRSNESSEAGSATGVPVGADYAGPKLFVKPSAKSNRHIIINAISHCCLAGSVNTDLKNKVLEEIAKSNAKHFLILFRDASCGYRGLYGFDPDSEDVFKIMGVGPRQISNKMIEKYYKYNSGAKSFSEVSSTKHVSVSIDALVLQNSVWKPTKAPAKGYR